MHPSFHKTSFDKTAEGALPEIGHVLVGKNRTQANMPEHVAQTLAKKLLPTSTPLLSEEPERAGGGGPVLQNRGLPAQVEKDATVPRTSLSFG